jgi:hypothetical protein
LKTQQQFAENVLKEQGQAFAEHGFLPLGAQSGSQELLNLLRGTVPLLPPVNSQG